MIQIYFSNQQEPISLEIDSYYLCRLRTILHGIAKLVYGKERPAEDKCQQLVRDSLVELGILDDLSDDLLVRALYDSITIADPSKRYLKIFKDIFKPQRFLLEKVNC